MAGFTWTKERFGENLRVWAAGDNCCIRVRRPRDADDHNGTVNIAYLSPNEALEIAAQLTQWATHQKAVAKAGRDRRKINRS